MSHQPLAVTDRAPLSLVVRAACDGDAMEVEGARVRRRPRRSVDGSAPADALEVVLEGRGGADALSLTFERTDRSFTSEERALVARLVAGIGSVRVALPGSPGADASADDELADALVDALDGTDGGGTGDLDPAAEPRPGVPPAPRVVDYADVLERCFFRLDEMSVEPTGERLVEVVRICAEATGVRSHWVAHLNGDDLVTVTHHQLLGERGDVVPIRRSRIDALAEDPRIPVALEGGSFAGLIGETIWAPYLIARGLVTCVGAGGYDDDARQWIVCLFDDGTRDVVPLRVLLSGAVQAALGVPLARRA